MRKEERKKGGEGGEGGISHKNNPLCLGRWRLGVKNNKGKEGTNKERERERREREREERERREREREKRYGELEEEGVTDRKNCWWSKRKCIKQIVLKVMESYRKKDGEAAREKKP